MAKITGETSTGFPFEFDERILTDWTYVALLGKITDKGKKDAEKLAVMQTLFLTILGEEQTNALIEHVRELNDGFAPIDEVMKELGEITSQKN